MGDAPAFDPSQPFAEKPAFDPAKPFTAAAPKTGAIESAVQGAVTGATAGWAPELQGLNKASGVSGVTDYAGAFGKSLALPIGAVDVAMIPGVGVNVNSVLASTGAMAFIGRISPRAYGLRGYM